LESFLKSDMSTKIISIQPLPLFSAALLLSAGSAFAQSATCSPLPTHQATPAEVAYKEAKYERAESLYQQAIPQPRVPPERRFSPSQTAAASPLSSEGCTQYANQNSDHPLNSTIQGGIIGWLDSGHLKPGQSISVKVLRDWIAPSCTLIAGATLYGHVLTATASKSASELAVVFDHGDC
jgi:hypothetical protein